MTYTHSVVSIFAAGCIRKRSLILKFGVLKEVESEEGAVPPENCSVMSSGNGIKCILAIAQLLVISPCRAKL